jgi:antitoxin VapB
MLGGLSRFRFLFDKYILVYILLSMGERARIFQNGGSQAVRLPKSCRFDDNQDELIVRKVGKKVILDPANEWPPEFLACLGSWNDDIPRPKSQSIGARKSPFERS